MIDVTVETTTYEVVLSSDAPPEVVISTVAVPLKGDRGDKGEKGEPGDAASDNLPDLTLIFENQLI